MVLTFNASFPKAVFSLANPLFSLLELMFLLVTAMFFKAEAQAKAMLYTGEIMVR